MLVDNKDPLNMSRQCALLGVNRSHVYYSAKATEDDTELLNRINELYLWKPAYGYRKIWAHLRKDGILINKKKVYRLMKELGIQSVAPKPNTSIPAKNNKNYPYLLKDLLIHKPNQVWAVDITYIRLPTGMVYLFALIDWYSRYIVGWTLTNTMCAEHAIYALEKGLEYGTPEICNADQGSQFTSDNWIAFLIQTGIQVSHDGAGRCVDNIRIERFWRTIKYEDINLKHYQNIIEARLGIAEFINYYNNERPHQALQYACPKDVFFVIREGGSIAAKVA